MRRRLHKRLRRRLYGATVEFRIYEDGGVRVRVDDASNDPGTEIAITGLVIKLLAESFEKFGVGRLRLTGPLVWKDDPSGADTQRQSSSAD